MVKFEEGNQLRWDSLKSTEGSQKEHSCTHASYFLFLGIPRVRAALHRHIFTHITYPTKASVKEPLTFSQMWFISNCVCHAHNVLPPNVICVFCPSAGEILAGSTVAPSPAELNILLPADLTYWNQLDSGQPVTDKQLQTPRNTTKIEPQVNASTIRAPPIVSL